MPTRNTDTWQGAYKIPWDDPDFSRRMLREHLSQDHDMASRRFEWIDKQVAWIHAGFSRMAPCDQWPCNTDTLNLWTAKASSIAMP